MKKLDEEYYYFRIKRVDYDKTLPSILELIPEKIMEKIEDKLASIFELFKGIDHDKILNRIKRMGEIEEKAIERIRNHGNKDKRAIIPHKLEKSKTIYDVIGYMVYRLLTFIDEKGITSKDRKTLCIEADRIMQEFMERYLSKKFISKYPKNRRYTIIGHIILSLGIFKDDTEFVKNEEAANFVASCLK